MIFIKTHTKMLYTKGEWKYFNNGYFFELKCEGKEKMMSVNVFLHNREYAKDSIMLSKEAEANVKLMTSAPLLLTELVNARLALIENGFHKGSRTIIAIDESIEKSTS